MTDPCVGIDLGTTHSLVGAVIDGKLRLFPDSAGNDLLPSVVGIDDDGKLLVGRAARNRRIIDPEGTVVSVKRRMGSAEPVRVGAQRLSPPQVSALILGALLDRVEAATGQRPTRAVITVPAFFSDAQRQATKDAGALAGLAVERLVNEPTAAAMTYQTGTEQRVLVYDLGGGTFDASILDRDQGFLEVRASRGDTRLGGDDVDAALVALVLGRLGAARPVVERDARAMTRLVEAVERAKVALSDATEVRLLEPFLAGEGASAVQLDMPLTRADVSAVARPLIEKTLRCVDDALGDAKLRPAALDRVLLVGGASRMPIVREMVAAHLGRPVHVDLDADRAVALGASLLGGRASGAEVDEVLIDITPHTLAVSILSEEMVRGERPSREDDLEASPVIPRNTVVPVERRRTLSTTLPDQRAVRLPITQGESSRAGDNTRLGVVQVDGLPPSPASSPVEVVFRLDISGVLHVSAVHLPSNRSAQVTIADSPCRLTSQKREAARREVEALRRQPADPAGAALAEGRPSEADLTRARALLARASRALARKPGGDAAIDRVEQLARSLSRAVDETGPDVASLTESLTDALLDLA